MNAAMTSEGSGLFHDPPTATINTFALLMFASSGLWGVSTWFVSHDLSRLVVAGFGMLGASAIFALVYFDYRRPVGIAVVCICWLQFAKASAATQRDMSAMAFGALVVPIPMAGLLFGRNAAIAIAAASAALRFVLGPTGLGPITPPELVELTAYGMWFGEVSLFAVSAGVVGSAIGRLQRIVTALQQSKARSEERNLKLLEEIRQR